MRTRRPKAGVRVISAIGVLLAAGLWSLGPVLTASTGGGSAQAQSPGDARGPVLLAYSLGGILTADGKLWQYRPDLDRWLTIDEAFREEGRTTHILPLPVPATEIQDMETFGFILTHSGQVWFYEMETDKWRLLPSPR